MELKKNITLSNIEVDNSNNIVYSLDMDNTAFEKTLDLTYEVINGVRTPKFVTKVAPESINFKITKNENGLQEILTSNKYGFILECNSFELQEDGITPIDENSQLTKQFYIYNFLDILFHGNTNHNHSSIYKYANPQPTQLTFNNKKYYTAEGSIIEITEETYIKNKYYYLNNNIYYISQFYDSSLTYYDVFFNFADTYSQNEKYYIQSETFDLFPYYPYLFPQGLHQLSIGDYQYWSFFIQDLFEDSEVITVNNIKTFKGLQALIDNKNEYYNCLNDNYGYLGNIPENIFQQLISEGKQLYQREGSNYTQTTDWNPVNNEYFISPPTQDYPPYKTYFYEALKEIYISIGYSLRKSFNDFKFYLIVEDGDLNIQYGPYYASICWSSNETAAKLTIDKYDITAAVTNNYLSFNSKGLSLYSTGVDGAGGLTIYNGNEQVFWATNDGTLHLKGDIRADSGYFTGTITAQNSYFEGEVHAESGSFKGTIEAENGSFNGKITSTEGSIGGITINNEGITTLDEYNNPIFAINNDGSIFAKNIELGAEAKISDYIKLGNGYIYNPEKYDQKFIEVKNNNTTQLLINDDGTGTLGNIYFNGDTSIIQGYNNNVLAWELNPNTSIFNNADITGTLNSTIFKTQQTQLAGSTFLFKTGVEFDNNPLSDLNIGDTFIINSLYGDELQLNYLYRISNASHNAEFFAKYLGDEEFEVLTNIPTGIYNLAIEMGEIIDNNGVETISDWLVGINSTRNTGQGMYPNGITISEILKQDNNFVITPRIILGDLSEVEGISSGTYGLYADSVYLTGTLTTEYLRDSGIGYAGINTLSGVRFNKTISGLTADNSPIVIWAGADGIDANAIQDARFQITDNGTLYATQGYFSGTIITDATIQASELTVDKIYGSKTAVDDDGNSIGLRIQDADVGIEFYTPDKDGEPGILAFKITEDEAFFNVPLTFGNAVHGNIFENAAGSFNRLVVRDNTSVPGTIYITPQFIYLNNIYTNDSLLNSIPYKIGNVNNQIQIQHNLASILNLDDNNAQFKGKLASNIGLLIGDFSSPSGEYRIPQNNDKGIDLYIYS